MDITIRNLQTKVSIRLPRIKEVARRSLQHVDIHEGELSVIFVPSSRMKTLNTKYLKHSYVTDILTFDYSPPSPKRRKRIMAEIVIAPEVAVRNAKAFSLPLHKEIELYVIHGVLHLAGYDDHAPKDTARMREKELELVEITKK
jgi:probable rRNA maturation factor